MFLDQRVKYNQDLRSLIICLTTITLLLIGFVSDINTRWYFLIIPLQTLLSFLCCIINHNHTHHSTFKSSNLNRLFEYLLTFARGHTSFGVITPHNLNHHIYVGTHCDWSHDELAGKGWGIVRIFRYLLQSSLQIWRERNKKGSPKLNIDQEKNRKRQKYFLLILMLIAFYCDPLKFILLWLLPWFLSMEILLFINLIQHDGLGKKSRDFTGKNINFFVFNNGFHTVHHFNPNLHWSLLPSHHQTLKTDQSSLLLFIMKNYFLKIW
jgi:beta-carotene hydroxylase